MGRVKDVFMDFEEQDREVTFIVHPTLVGEDIPDGGNPENYLTDKQLYLVRKTMRINKKAPRIKHPENLSSREAYEYIHLYYKD